MTCFLLPQLEGSSDEGTGSPVRGRLIRGAFADSEDLYRKDKDFNEDGGWFDGPDDYAPADYMKQRQSIVQFSGEKDNDEETDHERETNFVRQKTPHPKELKLKAHKLFGSPTKTPDQTVDEGYNNGMYPPPATTATDNQTTAVPITDNAGDDEEDEQAYRGKHGLVSTKQDAHILFHFLMLYS